MSLLDVEITTPAAIALNLTFANGKSVNVPQGGKGRYQLTGDELGRVQAAVDGARRVAKREGALDSEVLGGGCKVLTPGYYDEAPVGSKKHRADHPDEYDGVTHKSAKPAKAEKPAKK